MHLELAVRHGDLGRWTERDVGEFLLEWCPPQADVPQDEWRHDPGAVGRLHRLPGRLLAPGSSSVDDVAAAAAGMTHGFVAAVGDESNFGLAKSRAAAAAEGVDMGDPDRLQERMADLNVRPEEERCRSGGNGEAGPVARRVGPPADP